MSRYNPNRGPVGKPGTGIGSLGVRDHQERARRAKLTHTPICVAGVWYLGTDSMPQRLKSRLLKGVYSYKVDRRLS